VTKVGLRNYLFIGHPAGDWRSAVVYSVVATCKLLGVLRIAILMLIGNAGFPDVAAYGFHSQAGWIAFNSVACGLAFLSRRGSGFNHAVANP
jgi:exosortase/archaeosortase family protein